MANPATNRANIAGFRLSAGLPVAIRQLNGEPMDSSDFTKSAVEQAALAWLESVGWPVLNGAEIVPRGPAPEVTP
jgi:hypothetical protein